MNTNYTLERCITNDDNWEHYCELGCDETIAIEHWHYWQEKQPNYKFRMYKVTKELVAASQMNFANKPIFDTNLEGNTNDS